MIDGMTIGIAVGLIAVAIALFERGYKTYLEERKADPDLRFGLVYLLNIFMTAGGVGTIVVAVIPSLLSALAETDTTAVTISSILIQATIGYTTAYRVLDGLNNATSNNVTIKTVKVEARKAAKAKADNIDTVGALTPKANEPPK